MGDKKRFDVTAELIARHFDKDLAVADVAGGKGYLQQALRQRGFSRITTFDKRKGRKDRPTMRYQYRFFDESVKERFDLIIGLHPDAATDLIIAESFRRQVPFLIVPCCIMPNRYAFWGKHNTKQWQDHLIKLAQKKGFRTEVFYLKISGMNTAIIGKI